MSPLWPYPPAPPCFRQGSVLPLSLACIWLDCLCWPLHRVQELCESRDSSWAPRPNEPDGFCGERATLNHAHALVTVCLEHVIPTSEDVKVKVQVFLVCKMTIEMIDKWVTSFRFNEIKCLIGFLIDFIFCRLPRKWRQSGESVRLPIRFFSKLCMRVVDKKS